MKKRNNELNIKRNILLDEIKKTRQALEIAYSNFQCVSDPDLIDCYIYEMNAVDLRYKYLINQIRELSIPQSTH